MTELDPNSYWQRKATFENLGRTIPGLKDLRPGEGKKYFDDNGELHFEVVINPNEGLKSPWGKVVDYIQGELTSKPFTQIIMESKPYEIKVSLAFAVLDVYANLALDRGLNEIFNDYNQVHLIDHKTGEVHQFSGSMENGQLNFEVSYKKDSGFEMPRRGYLRDRERENYNTKFEGFLGKLTPDFKARFAGEKEERALSNV